MTSWHDHCASQSPEHGDGETNANESESADDFESPNYNIRQGPE